MSGHLVAFEPMWVGPACRTELRVYLAWPKTGWLDGVTGWLRIGAAGALGALFGATTHYPGFWLAVALAVGWALNRLMSRAAAAGK
jgi:hypothetical protein